LTILALAASEGVIHFRTKKRLISLSPQGQMTGTAMHLIGNNKGGLPEERMERIADDNLAAQTPGIMASRRTPEAAGQRRSTR